MLLKLCHNTEMHGHTTLANNIRGLGWGIGFLALAALLIPHPAWMILLVCLGGAWAFAYGWVRVLHDAVSAERALQANWVAIDDVLVEQFTIHNRSWLPVPYLEIRDRSNLPGYRPAFVVSLGRNSSNRWRQAAVCTQRGRYQLGPWLLQFSDPFGFYTVTIAYDDLSEIVIHPPILPTLPIALPIGSRDGGRSRQRNNRQAELNAAGVRHYRPSDPRQHIHWPTTARHNTLFVREFEQDAGGDVWLMLDMAAANQIGKGRFRSEEQAILLAATLAVRILQQRQAVGLATYGKTPQIITPGHGIQQEWRILEALATATADGEASLAIALRDLRRVVRSGSALLLISAVDGASAEWISPLLEHQQAGVSVSVVLLERGSFGAPGGSSALQQQLTLAGIRSDRLGLGALRGSAEKPKALWPLREAVP